MTHAYSPNEPHAAVVSVRADGTVQSAGRWTLQYLAAVERQLSRQSWPQQRALVWDASAIQAMDTAGAWVLQRMLDTLQQQGRQVTARGLRPEFAQLLEMIASDDIQATPPSHPAVPGWLEATGRLVWAQWLQALGFLSFVGESMIVFLRLLLRPHRVRWHALFYNLNSAGLRAVPIAGLLAFLMGVVIAYQAAVQLRPFGANIFIVDLVGISMLREIAPLVTAIVIAGRSGSAFTAQIGTMKVTEEVDALRTLGIAPMEILVLPRVLALIIALPLLTVLADALGVFGGMVIARTQLQIDFRTFIDRFAEVIALRHYLIGVGKAPVFAAIIALVACYQGFQVRGSADSVGHQTTTSVVQAIFLVIIADAFFSIVFNWFDI